MVQGVGVGIQKLQVVPFSQQLERLISALDKSRTHRALPGYRRFREPPIPGV